MKFNSITLDGQNYALSGTFVSKKLNSGLITFDTDLTLTEIILTAFFGNDLANVIHGRLVIPDHIVLHSDNASIYISNPRYHFGLYHLATPISFKSFLIDNFDYYLVNSKTDLSNIAINSYQAEFVVRSRFDSYFKPTEITKSGRLLNFQIFNFDIRMMTSVFEKDTRLRKLTLMISSDEETFFENYENLFFTIVEIIILSMGAAPTIINRKIISNGKTINYHRDLLDSHGKVNQRSGYYPLIEMSKTTIFNSSFIEKYSTLQKVYKPIFYVLYSNLNADYYIDLKTTTFIQLLTGFIENLERTTNPSSKRPTTLHALKIAFSNPHAAHFFPDQKTRDRYLNQAVAHRDYFTHFNLNKISSIFSAEDCLNMNTRLQCTLRIFLFKELNLLPDSKIFNETINKITI